MFKSIPDYRKIVRLLFLVQNDQVLLKECGFFKNDVHRLSLEIKNFLMEEDEENLDHNKEHLSKEFSIKNGLIFCHDVWKR